MAAIAMVTKVQKMLNSLQTADPFKIFKMAANIKIKKIVKNSKWTDFNGNGYLQGVRHADHMATILVCYGGHLEPKMVAKIQRSSDLGDIWFPTW